MSWKGRGDIAYRLAWLARQVQGYAVITSAVRSLFAAELGISDRTVAAQLAIGTKKCTDFMLRRIADRRPAR